MKHVCHVDFNGQSRFGHPGIAHVGGNTDGDEFLSELTMPVSAVFPIGGPRRSDSPQTSLDLTSHMIRWPGATDGDQPVVFQVLKSLLGNRFGKEDRD